MSDHIRRDDTPAGQPSTGPAGELHPVTPVEHRPTEETPEEREEREKAREKADKKRAKDEAAESTRGE